MRYSRDEIRDGRVWTGFDYALQVWVRDGVIMPCGHPARRADERRCCPARTLGGQRIEDVPGAEDRTDG